MLSAFGLRVCVGYMLVHASTCKINTSQWHCSGVNGCHFVRKQYKPTVKSFRISDESRELRMPSHLSTYLRERIVVLWEEGKTVSKVLQTLESKGKRTSRTTVWRWVFRWRSNHSLWDQYRPGSRSKITVEIAVEIQRLLARKFFISISAPAIQRYIRMHLKWAVVR